MNISLNMYMHIEDKRDTYKSYSVYLNFLSFFQKSLNILRIWLGIKGHFIKYYPI